MPNKLVKAEKSFPFYKMDVNGFILKLNHAITMSSDSKDIADKTKVYQMDYISGHNLSVAFEGYAAWNALSDKESDFAKML